MKKLAQWWRAVQGVGNHREPGWQRHRHVADDVARVNWAHLQPIKSVGELERVRINILEGLLVRFSASQNDPDSKLRRSPHGILRSLRQPRSEPERAIRKPHRLTQNRRLHPLPFFPGACCEFINQRAEFHYS